ncbi:MAG: dTMP kinase [Deltaproteobacteria bacterium]|nr:dTMP kinase [Deltaproteobacteria bacterium]
MNNNRGKFIVFEGIDGSGKSTQVKRLANRLIKEKKNICKTFEPTDGPIGSLARQMMTGRIKADNKTIALLFAADRIDHLLNDINGIVSMLKKGINVISDRYYFSSYAYQSSYIKMERIIEANIISAQTMRPDVNIFIDINPQTAFNRLKKKRSLLELYENITDMQKVRKSYFKAFDKLKNEEKILIIDGNDAPDNIELKIWNNINKLLT